MWENTRTWRENLRTDSNGSMRGRNRDYNRGNHRGSGKGRGRGERSDNRNNQRHDQEYSQYSGHSRDQESSGMDSVGPAHL